MKNKIKEYFHQLSLSIEAMEITDGEGRESDYPAGLSTAAEMVISRAGKGRKIIFIGNGGSSAIASHMATDYFKNGGMKAMAFNDPSLLTCLSNDYGYAHVFEKPLEMYAEPEDLLFAISSSGNSDNILRGVEAGRKKGCGVITLSGFERDNALRSKGDLNIYVPVQEYGPVEVIHHTICHCILDTVMSAGRG